jgi:small subunit ribosomal protein S13
MEAKPELRRIVRLASTDIDGNLSVERALRRIKGVGFMFARTTCIKTGVDRKGKIGLLDENELKNIERFIKAPEAPPWMLNRRKDIETGKDLHIVMSDLDLKKRDDINLMKRTHTYKGVRHELGQPVRGQRTRSSFRTSKTVGVSRKKIIAAAKAAPAAKAEKK